MRVLRGKWFTSMQPFKNTNFFTVKVTRAGGSAGELLCSGLLLLYTAVLAPVQICLWDYDNPCNVFPTLYFDVFVDAFFIVQSPPHLAPLLSNSLSHAHKLPPIRPQLLT